MPQHNAKQRRNSKTDQQRRSKAKREGKVKEMKEAIHREIAELREALKDTVDNVAVTLTPEEERRVERRVQSLVTRLGHSKREHAVTGRIRAELSDLDCLLNGGGPPKDALAIQKRIDALIQSGN